MTRRTLIRIPAAAVAAVALVAVFQAGEDPPGKRATPAAAPSRAFEVLDSGKLFPPGLPFSEAVRVGNLLFLSGQLGIKPGTLELVPGGIEAESRRTLDNIKATLENHGYSMRDLVKCTVMMADISEWGAFNAIYKTYFDTHYPARSAFGADGLALGARVEVECIAAVGE